MSEPEKKETTSVFNKNVSRRDVLKAAGIGGVGVLIGASGIGGALALADVLPTSQKKRKYKCGCSVLRKTSGRHCN